jgi:hypothetical protein
MGYVDGSYPCPPEWVSRLNAEGRPVLVINPEHRTWVQQDAAILSTIVSSMTTSVSGRVLFATTAQEAWMALSTSFASQSTSQAMAILTKLAEAQKLDKTITVYFDEVQNLAATLSSIGQPLTTAQFTAYVLKGLDADYDNLVENINGRDTPIAPQDLYARLLSTEQRIATRRALSPATDFSANATSYSDQSGDTAEQAVIDAATKAGFKFDGKSEINANPKDTKDHPFGVWTLPPTRQSSEDSKPVDPAFDRAKYDAIGESDRMTLRFVKPKK